jgi:hypothetical protein
MKVRLAPIVVCLIAGSFSSTPAYAQWYVGGYLGGNYTHAADVSIAQPGEQTNLTFEGVRFAARPLESPQYYGVRIGRLFGGRGRWGIEVEFVHLKVISETARTYPVSGELAGLMIDEPTRMDSIVQRYDMTHGLNFLVVNLVSRRPVGNGRFSIVSRVGVGPTLPHAESSIGFVNRQQYEYAGPGLHAAGGVAVRVNDWFTPFIEYKLTAARPTISVPAGTGRTTSVSHHGAIGFTIGRTR